MSTESLAGWGTVYCYVSIDFLSFKKYFLSFKKYFLSFKKYFLSFKKYFLSFEKLLSEALNSAKTPSRCRNPDYLCARLLEGSLLGVSM